MAKRTKLVRLEWVKNIERMMQSEDGQFCSYQNVKIVIDEYKKELKAIKKRKGWN